MTREPLALGIVGCGRLAAAGYLPALVDVPDLRLVAVADPAADRRRVVADLAAQRWGRTVSDHAGAAELLAAAPVDVLILATPAPAHLDDASAAAAAGVPTLVEKPPAPDAAGAAALAALDPPPWVAFNRRFDPGARSARAHAPIEGELELRLEIGYRRAGWGAHAVADDALLDLGPHLVDWARWVTRSEVVEVTRATTSAERAELELRLGRGRAVVRAATDQLHHELLEVRHASGRLVARHRLGGPVAAVRGRIPGRAGPGALVTSLAGQLAALASTVRGFPDPHLGTAADGHAAMAVIDAARACAGGGRTTAHPIA